MTDIEDVGATIDPLHEITESTREHMEHLLEACRGYADFWCDNSTPAPGSELADEEDSLTVRSTSVLAAEAAMVALDHLHLTASFVLAEKRLTAFATFTVVRSAITAAAVAAWLVAPEKATRLERALNLNRQQARNEKVAAEEMIGPDRPKTPENEAYNTRTEGAKKAVQRMNETLQQIESDVARLKLEPTAITRQPRDNVLIEEAAELVSPTKPHYEDFGPVVEIRQKWRTLSAHAHGQAWAANLSARVETNPITGVRTSWNPPAWLLDQGILIAMDLLEAATQRYRELAHV
ncbi:MULTISPECIES: hypothetical protein [unclassified Rhodococcus (in: high G+C Gram-positive bacteria)]|uniref:hypothetical protein n=1 Tax=unclassified Rhodococcus (in: high G+C Gram-positive bacteria) TaxID=192944 RepID=UPI0024B6713F|nr:hypothetical protein [Rhodococcus sp. IEGM 1302]MDI9943271.1 hypothetical protein [Rhodococcus sp. IEGM 1302]